jgi:hypothetical protein
VDWRVKKIAIEQRIADCELRTATDEKASKMLVWIGLERHDARGDFLELETMALVFLRFWWA